MIVEEILQHASVRPEATAVVDAAGRTLGFGELGRRVASVRSGLRKAGMRPGDAVFFAVRPGPDALVLGLAVLSAGATIVVADPGAGPELFAARAQLVQAGGGHTWAAAESVLYALTARKSVRALVRRRGLVLPDFAQLDAARHVRTGRWLPGTPRAALALSGLLRTAPPGELGDGESEMSPDTAALVVFTSGTTAAPRGVVHTRGSLTAGSALIGERVGWGPGDLVHTDQLMIGLPALAAGAGWSLSGLPSQPGRVLRHLAERHASHHFGTPADVAKLLDVAEAGGGRLPDALRCVMLGAAPVPPAVLRRVRAAAPGAEILSVYGTTEALPIAVTTAEAKLAHAAQGDLLGEPLPGVMVRIGEGSGGAESSEGGEILVRGPNVAPRYLGQADFAELATGDLGRLDADGRLILLGRAKDMLIRGSFNLYPGLYEPAIAALPGVADCAYVGLPDPVTLDEQVVLAVVAAVGQDPDVLVKRLASELTGVIDTAACPDRVVPVAAIPRGGRTAKPDRGALRKLLAASAAASAMTGTVA
jgi:acyl-CoA synthetase (AMP-forming)/AMP-acid ligase II